MFCVFFNFEPSWAAFPGKMSAPGDAIRLRQTETDRHGTQFSGSGRSTCWHLRSCPTSVIKFRQRRGILSTWIVCRGAPLPLRPWWSADRHRWPAAWARLVLLGKLWEWNGQAKNRIGSQRRHLQVKRAILSNLLTLLVLSYVLSFDSQLLRKSQKDFINFY